MGFLDETGLARFLDNIKSRYVKNATYCADCNAALTPGHYYIDSQTLNAPVCVNGILFVYGVGDASSDVYQVAFVKKYNSAAWRCIEGRVISISNGSYSSSTPWFPQNYYANNIHGTMSIDGTSLVLTPPSGPQLKGQGGSNYDYLRMYHPRDKNRDSSLNTYGFIGRYTNSNKPADGGTNQSSVFFGSQEGGIPSPFWSLGGYYRCASNVVYTDETEETVYGKYLVVGDVYNGKTVASVTYTRSASNAFIYFAMENVATVGTTSYPMAHIYATTGTVETSDERMKQSIRAIPDDVLDAWGEVGWVQYQLNSSVEKKGTEKARLHTGAIAQRIDEVFKAHGLDASKYGLFCYDSWEDEFEEDENGNKIQTQTAGDKYSLRYEEALVMEAAYQRRRADRIEERLAALEGRLNG